MAESEPQALARGTLHLPQGTVQILRIPVVLLGEDPCAIAKAHVLEDPRAIRIV